MDRTDQITISTLPCGLRAVHIRRPGATEFCGLTFNAGSRDELATVDFGLAHFVEHTIFKGTARRSDSYINSRMELLGGELNAFTTKEETTIYAAMPAGCHSRAVTLLGELAAESVFPDKKIDLEREVICDEIDSYLDTPGEAVYDSFDELVYGDNPLAHNILGTKETVGAFTSERCRLYLRERFTADNGVYFYCGPESARRVFDTTRRTLAALPAQGAPRPRTIPPYSGPFQHMVDHGRHQCHTVMGVPVGGLHSPDRYAMALAVNILGGPGMNSRLNVELRERRGLVYTVEASTALMSDCGMMTIYFGCDHADLERCRRLIATTIARMADKPMGATALKAWKRQYLGQLTLARDNKENLAIGAGRAVLHGLEPATLAATAEKLAAITPGELREASEILAQAPLRCLIFA